MALSVPWIYPVRVAQVIFGIIVLGLTAYGLFPSPSIFLHSFSDRLVL